MVTERRQHARVSPKGTVVAHAGEHVHRGRISNLGFGGVLAMTAVTAPAVMLGRAVRVEIRFDGTVGDWLFGNGKVSRIAPDAMALTLDELSPELQRVIGEMVGSSRAHGRVMNMVLIDSDVVRRTRMSIAFQMAGCTVVDATSPLEAIVRLGESMFEPDLIAIADSAPAAVSDELRLFVEREHPNTKLVSIGDGDIGPEGIAHWLSSADPSADMPSRVREMLGRPRRPTNPG
jgi:PilZ domain